MQAHNSKSAHDELIAPPMFALWRFKDTIHTKGIESLPDILPRRYRSFCRE
jgi:hypothetical protein